MRCVLGFVYKLIIDLHITGQATHLNLFDLLSIMRLNANCTLNCVDIHGLSIG